VPVPPLAARSFLKKAPDPYAQLAIALCWRRGTMIDVESRMWDAICDKIPSALGRAGLPSSVACGDTFSRKREKVLAPHRRK
jgi:hypothetical protein